MGPEDAAWAVPLGFFTMVTALAVGVPFVRALAKRWGNEGVQPKIPAEVLARLERMEQAIDSVAVEVERISEGQRFTTRLLTERGADSVAARYDRPSAANTTRGGGM